MKRTQRSGCGLVLRRHAGWRGARRRRREESKMTSYTTGENKAGHPWLVYRSGGPDGAHQMVPVEKSSLPRVLRLTGAVAYNAFKTTPVFSAVGGPVQEILASPAKSCTPAKRF